MARVLAVPIADAQPGALVRTGLKRHAPKSWGWSAVDHYCVVGHRYGHSKEIVFAAPLCGGDGGRAGTSDTEELCKRCERIAESPDRFAAAVERTTRKLSLR